MDIPFFNSEHYADPTAYEALKNIEAGRRDIRAFRPIVYICSPFSGDVEANVASARRYCRFAVDSGYIPIAVHLLYPQFMDDDDPEERELALFFGTAVMSRCSEVWVFGDRISSGMASEITRAKWKHYRIRYFDTDCREVTDHA